MHQFLGEFQVGWRYKLEGKSTGRRHIGAESAEKGRVFPRIWEIVLLLKANFDMPPGESYLDFRIIGTT
jgi:hypothetical protein